MVGVFGSVAGALGRLMLEEVTVRPVRARGVAPQLERAGAQHEREQVRRDGAADGIRLRERRGVIPARQVEHAHVVARVDVERRQHGICLQRHRQEEPGTVGLPLRMQGHHPVVESRGPLLGGHL